MFGRKTSEPNLGQETRSHVYELATEPGDYVQWVSPLLGRFSLRHMVLPDGFELNAVRLLDEDTMTYPASRYIICHAGELHGVFHNRIRFEEYDLEEVEKAMQFQLDNGLFKPTDQDRSELVTILRSGVEDAVYGET